MFEMHGSTAFFFPFLFFLYNYYFRGGGGRGLLVVVRFCQIMDITNIKTFFSALVEELNVHSV